VPLAPLAVPAALVVFALLAVPALVPPRPSTDVAADPISEEELATPATCSSDCRMLVNSPCVEPELWDVLSLPELFEALDEPAPRVFLAHASLNMS
jgi:hypothetical protein